MHEICDDASCSLSPSLLEVHAHDPLISSPPSSTAVVPPLFQSLQIQCLQMEDHNFQVLRQQPGEVHTIHLIIVLITLKPLLKL